jgi:hypothetical protein
MSGREAQECHQRRRRQQHCPLISAWICRTDQGDGQVRRLPGNRHLQTAAEPQQHPGGAGTPEDATDASRLPAVGAGLRHHRERSATKCTIRRCVLWG